MAMDQADRPVSDERTGTSETARRLRALARRILGSPHRSAGLCEYLRDASRLFSEQVGCAAVGIWLETDGRLYRSRLVVDSGEFEYERLAAGDPAVPPQLTELHELIAGVRSAGPLQLLPLSPVGRPLGLVRLEFDVPPRPSENDLFLWESLAELLGAALAHRSTRLALRERLKELTCLLQINQIVAESEGPVAEVLQAIVERVPPAWQFPEYATGRLQLGQEQYATGSAQVGLPRLRAPIRQHGQEIGAIEVSYDRPMPELDEGPFLAEERSLLDAIARKVGLLMEQRRADQEREAYRLQLMHADRLATIGQLAAGVAHELNEPLGHILGFAQLARKAQDLSRATANDLDRIVQISLDARKVIRRLMLFAREVPARLEPLDVNLLVREGSRLFGRRCTKNGIDLVLDLALDLPPIVADSGQLNQVIINLIVNSMHAMPKGGRLSLATSASEHGVRLTVTDTGVGMSEEVRRKAFLPFFTTKDVDQGTGLGLAVVHGIVKGHGGSVEIQSTLGEGTRFEVLLPPTGSGPPATRENP
jgi:signal transduction histidine kinase